METENFEFDGRINRSHSGFSTASLDEDHKIIEETIMGVYLIANYKITNPEGYAAYPQNVLPTLIAYGGEILAADYESEIIEGEASNVTVVVKFPSKGSARDWYDSDEYQKIVNSRIDNTEGFLLFADEFKIP